MQISVKQQWAITLELGGKKWTWTPRTVDVDNKTFFKCSKWDRQFVKAVYLGAKALKFSKSGTVDCNVRTLDTLTKERQSAVNIALAEAMAVPDGEEPQYANKKRRKSASTKHVKALKRHAHFLPPTVVARLDGFHDEIGMQCPVDLVMLTEGFWSKDIWVELSEANVGFLMRSIRNDIRMGRRGLSRKQKPDDESQEGNLDNDSDGNDDGADADQNIHADPHGSDASEHGDEQ
jgi:hypothetical protein